MTSDEDHEGASYPLSHPHAQYVVWPEERTDHQQELVNSNNLDKLPDELDHPRVTDVRFIGDPEKTTVFSIRFEPGMRGSPNVPSEWLLEAQDQGWEISNVHTHTRYRSRIRSRLRRLPVIGSLFGDRGLLVRVQRRDTAHHPPGETTDSPTNGEQLDGDRNPNIPL